MQNSEWGQQMHSAERSPTTNLQTSFRLAQEQRLESFMEWVSIVKHPSLTSPSAKRSIGCSGIKHSTTGLSGTTRAVETGVTRLSL